MRNDTAVLIDFDNAYLTLRDMDRAAARAFARNPAQWITERAGFSGASDHRSYIGEGFRFEAREAARVGVRCVICRPAAKGFDNAADHRMVVDAMSLATSPHPPERIVVVSADANYVPLLHELNSRGIETVVVGSSNTSAAMRNTAERFVNIATTPDVDEPEDVGSQAEVIDITTKTRISSEGLQA